MAIRDRFRRALHKSTSSSNVSSDNSSRNSVNNITTTNTTVSDSSEGSSPRTATSSKLFPWRSNDPESSSRKEKSESRKSKKSSSKPVHPRDKPLTATNLRHQEMLSGFNMTFGSSPSRLSQLVPAGPWDEFEGVSPCCTRNPSFDGGRVDPVASHDGSSTSLDSDAYSSSGMPPPKVANY